MPNAPHQFKHRDVVRLAKAGEAAGLRNPTSVSVCLPNGTTITIAGKPDGKLAPATAKPSKATVPPSPSRRSRSVR